MKPYNPDSPENNAEADAQDSIAASSSADAGTADAPDTLNVIIVRPATAAEDDTIVNSVEPPRATAAPEPVDYTYNSSLATAQGTQAEFGTPVRHEMGDVSGTYGAADYSSPENRVAPRTSGFTGTAPLGDDSLQNDRGLVVAGTTDSGNGAEDGTVDATDDTGETEAIRAQIEQTRSEMSATIDAIQQKISPQNLVDQAKDSVREATIGRVENMVNDARDTAKEAGNGFLDVVKQNPLPAALAAVGLGWLFMKSRNNNRNQSRYDYRYAPPGAYPYPYTYPNPYPYRPELYAYEAGYRGQGSSGVGERVGDAAGQVGAAVGGAASQVRDTAGNVAGQVGQTVGDVASTVGQTAGDVVGQVGQTAGNVAGQVGEIAGNVGNAVQETAGNLGTGVQYQAQRAQSQLQRMLYENPLAVGAAAAVIGAAVGMMVPESQPEHKIMGEARDSLVDKAQSAAQNTMDKVSQVASEAASAARQEASDQGLVADNTQQ